MNHAQAREGIALATFLIILAATVVTSFGVELLAFAHHLGHALNNVAAGFAA